MWRYPTHVQRQVERTSIEKMFSCHKWQTDQIRSTAVVSLIEHFSSSFNNNSGSVGNLRNAGIWSLVSQLDPRAAQFYLCVTVIGFLRGVHLAQHWQKRFSCSIDRHLIIYGISQSTFNPHPKSVRKCFVQSRGIHPYWTGMFPCSVVWRPCRILEPSFNRGATSERHSHAWTSHCDGVHGARSAEATGVVEQTRWEPGKASI